MDIHVTSHGLLLAGQLFWATELYRKIGGRNESLHIYSMFNFILVQPVALLQKKNILELRKFIPGKSQLVDF